MVGFWGRRKREEQERRDSADEDLARRARTAIVTADERIRATDDELAFAVAELGESATEQLRAGLDGVKAQLAEALRMHQLNHDEVPDTAEELRTRNARIIELCEAAEGVLDESTEALRERIARVREAPTLLQRVRDDVARLRGRLPELVTTVARLEAQYGATALGRLRFTVEEIERMLDFAERSARLSEQRREAGRAEDANLALETATETVRRVVSLVDSADGFEIEAMRAQATLVGVVEDSRSDLVAAAAAPRTPEVAAAMERLTAELAAVNAASNAPSDPFARLSSLSAANAALDRAVAAARERALHPLPTLEHVRHDVGAADHALGIADRLINGHRGWIGADARTRLAEALRCRAEIDTLVVADETRERAQQLARRAAQLADEATRLAQRDIDSSRPDGDDWGFGRAGGGAGVLGPVLGGVLLGGLLEDIFD